MSPGEKFNALTHLGATVVALPAAIVLVVVAALGGDAWKVTSVSIYGVTLVSLYSLSTLYHGLRGSPQGVLRKLDHEGIYLLIAGSYTPFCLVTLRGPWGWTLFAVVWLLAAVGRRLTWAHGVWHLFVIAGSAVHYVAILRYVL